MANEWFFDPFQAEEEDIKAKQIKAIAAALKSAPTREMGDYTSRINDIAQQVQGEKELAEIPGMRSALQEKYRQSLARALSGESPEIQRLGAEPTTAPFALKQLNERLEMEADMRERAARRAARTQGTGEGGAPEVGGDTTYADALDEAMSRRPRNAAAGKILLESLRPVDPKYSAYVDPTGGMKTRPGAPAAIATQQNAMGDTVEIEMGDTSKQRVPKSQALDFLLNNPGARVLGMVQPPQVNAPTPPVAPPGPGIGPSTPPPVASPTGPVTAPSGGVPPGPGPGPGPGGPPPPQFNFSGSPEQIAQAKAIAEADLAKQSGPGIATPPGPGPITPSGAARPSGPVGSTPAPMDVEAYKNVKQENEKALQAWSSKSNVSDLKASLDQLKKLNAEPMYTGFYEAPMALENTLGVLGMGKSQKGKNIEKFEKSSGDIIAGLLPQYGSGNGISDADMRGAQMRVANARMDPESRADVIALMEDKVAFAEYANKRVPILVRQGDYTLAAAKDIAYTEWKEIRAKEDAAKKAQEAAPGTSPVPRGPGGQSGSMKNPAGALSQTVDALTDVAKNTGRGAANLFGFGDRQAAVADVERQEARAESEPIYGGAKKIFDIGKYSVALPFGPLGGALVAGGLAASQPSESRTGQIVEGMIGASEGAVLGKALNLIRGLPITKQIQVLEDTIVAMPKGTRGKAALQRELDGLRLQLDRLGGTVTDTARNAVDFVTSPLRGVLNVLKGR